MPLGDEERHERHRRAAGVALDPGGCGLGGRPAAVRRGQGRPVAAFQARAPPERRRPRARDAPAATQRRAAGSPQRPQRSDRRPRRRAGSATTWYCSVGEPWTSRHGVEAEAQGQDDEEQPGRPLKPTSRRRSSGAGDSSGAGSSSRPQPGPETLSDHGRTASAGPRKQPAGRPGNRSGQRGQAARRGSGRRRRGRGVSGIAGHVASVPGRGRSRPACRASRRSRGRARRRSAAGSVATNRAAAGRSPGRDAAPAPAGRATGPAANDGRQRQDEHGGGHVGLGRDGRTGRRHDPPARVARCATACQAPRKARAAPGSTSVGFQMNVA